MKLESTGLCLFLVCCVYFDLKTDRIPNRLNLSGLIFGLILSVLLHGTAVFPTRLLWTVLPAAALMILFKYRVMGAGDIKLLCVCGAFAGRRMLSVAAGMFILTALYGLVRLLLRATVGVSIRSRIHMSVPALMSLIIIYGAELITGGDGAWV